MIYDFPLNLNIFLDRFVNIMNRNCLMNHPSVVCGIAHEFLFTFLTGLQGETT